MTIKELALAGNDARGYTAEYQQPRTGTHLIVYRKAGTISGRHYHKGLSATKDPEILILLHGTCTLSWFDVRSNDKTPATQVVNGPVQIEVPPYIWHEVLAGTDCVMIELNSIAEHVADTFYLDQQ